MSDSDLPTDQSATYERLEFTNFGSGRSAFGSNKQEEEPEFVLPTAADIEEIQRQAHEEGYQAGFAAGSQRIAALLNTLTQAMQQTDQEIAQELLNLSIEVARQMVQQELKIHPEILLNTIREAIGSLPHFSQGAHIVLHPEDAAMLRASMGEQLSHSGWKIFEDSLIERGGARIETAHSQIDATVANRWKRIVSSIGQDSSWIQE